MEPMLLSGRIFNDVGIGLNGATITVYPANSDTPTTTATTGNDSHGKAGYWQVTGLAVLAYRVKIEYNGKVRWLHGETATQFSEVNVGTAVQLTGDGNLVLVNPTDPTNGSSVDSPSITLTGAYDSDATAGVTRTDKSVTVLNDVADDGTYGLAVTDASGTGKVWHSKNDAKLKAVAVCVEGTTATTFTGTTGTSVISQSVVIPVRSIVTLNAQIFVNATGSTNPGNYGVIVGHDSTTWTTSESYLHQVSWSIPVQAARSRLMDAGTYTFFLKATAHGGATGTLLKDVANRNYLDIVAVPTAS